jgi:hypothetical protein
MKRLIAVVLGLTLIAGVEFTQARGGGGGRGGGGHAASGGHPGGHPGMGQGGRVTGGPPHFTTGPMHFTGGRPIGHPGVGGRPPAVIVGHPPHHRVIVGGAFVVGAPFFWYPPYPYPYYPYPYPYVSPAYGGPAYTQTPTYIEQGAIAYYCPDYQDYYPNVQSCPSPWMQVVPGAGPAVTPQ